MNKESFLAPTDIFTGQTVVNISFWSDVKSSRKTEDYKTTVCFRLSKVHLQRFLVCPTACDTAVITTD